MWYRDGPTFARIVSGLVQDVSFFLGGLSCLADLCPEGINEKSGEGVLPTI